MADYRSEIRQFILDHLSDDEIELKDDDNFFEKRFVNSLFAMKLVQFVESTYNVQISNDELDIANFSTVNRIYDLLSQKLQKQETK